MVRRLSKTFGRFRAGPSTKAIGYIFGAFGVGATIVAGGTFGLFKGVDALSEISGNANYGSVECRRAEHDLSEALNNAVSGGNAAILGHVVDEIESYEQGEGERALGDECTFDDIRQRLVIFGLD